MFAYLLRNDKVDSPQRRTSLVLPVLLIPPVILTCLAFLTLARLKTSNMRVGTSLEVTPTATIDVAGLAMAHYQQGVTYHARGQYSQAETAYHAALAADPTLAVAYNALGNLYLDLGRPSKALRMFSQAVQAEPEVAEWWRNLGVVLANEWNLMEAEAALEKAVSLDPDNPDLIDELTQVYAQLERK